MFATNPPNGIDASRNGLFVRATADSVFVAFRDTVATVAPRSAIASGACTVRAQIAVKVSGDDLDEIRGLADSLRARFAAVPGIADLQVEKQVHPAAAGGAGLPGAGRPRHRAGPGAGRGAAPGGRRAGGRGGGWRAALRPRFGGITLRHPVDSRKTTTAHLSTIS